MTGCIYTFSSFLLHIHRGFALLLPSRASWVFRTFNALPLPTKSHGGSPIICLCPGAFAIPRPTNLHGGSPINMPPVLPVRTPPNPSARYSASMPVMSFCSWVLRHALLFRTRPNRGAPPGRALFPVPIDVSSHGIFVSGAPTRFSAMLPVTMFLPASSWLRKE